MPQHETHLLEEILYELRRIRRRLDAASEHKTFQLGIILGDTMTPATLAVGQHLGATVVPLEADGITQTPDATLSDIKWSVDDQTIVSEFVNPDNTSTYTGLKPGTATVTVSATVTDQDGTVTDLTASNTITVTGTAAGRTVSLGINFGPPSV